MIIIYLAIALNAPFLLLMAYEGIKEAFNA